MMNDHFDIVEIKFGHSAGWWVRDEAHRLSITEIANELGGEYRALIKKVDAIRVCRSDDHFEDLKRVAGLEQLLTESVEDVAGITLDLPEGPAPTKKQAVTTTEALDGAEWQMIDGKWTLRWDDHEDYDDGLKSGDWTCWLTPQLDDRGEFEFKFEHSDRGGSQGGAVGADDIEAAKKSVRRYLEVWLSHWIGSLEDERYQREREEGDEA